VGAVEHLSRYFQYWRAHLAHPTYRFDLLWTKADPALQIPVVTPPDAPDDANLIRVGGPRTASVRALDPAGPPEPVAGRAVVLPEGTVLCLQASEPAEMDATLRALLARPDERHRY